MAILILLPMPLPAQQGPRQLGEEDLAKLRRNVEASKARSIEAERQAGLERQREELRRQEEALDYEEEDWEDDEPQQVSGSGFANVLDAFTGTLSSEMAKKQQEDAQRQRFLDNVRREAEAVDRQRQRELERQRLADERARLERQAQQQRQQAIAQQRQSAASGGGPGPVASSVTGSSTGTVMTAQQQASKARDDAMRASVAAERKRLAEQRARAEATEGRAASGGPQTAATIVGARSATPASVSSTPKAVATPVDYGPAKAWCRARRNEMAKQTEYQCMGPVQNLLSWYPTLSVPLGMAGCSGGEGYTPTPEHGGSTFNCGRTLKVGDLRMPTYDPYRDGGQPTRVTAGN